MLKVRLARGEELQSGMRQERVVKNRHTELAMLFAGYRACVRRRLGPNVRFKANQVWSFLRNFRDRIQSSMIATAVRIVARNVVRG